MTVSLLAGRMGRRVRLAYGIYIYKIFFFEVGQKEDSRRWRCPSGRIFYISLLDTWVHLGPTYDKGPEFVPPQAWSDQ